MTHEFTIPMALPSCANLREHWRVRAKRVKAQRQAVTWYWGYNHDLHPPFVVTLTRVAPRKLDDDNLASAFKAIRDQVAFELEIDDGSPHVSWRYAQVQGKGKPYVQIEVRSGAHHAD